MKFVRGKLCLILLFIVGLCGGSLEAAKGKKGDKTGSTAKTTATKKKTTTTTTTSTIKPVAKPNTTESTVSADDELDSLFDDEEPAKSTIKTTTKSATKQTVAAVSLPKKETIKTVAIPPDDDDDFWAELEADVPTQADVKKKAEEEDVGLNDFGGFLDVIPLPDSIRDVVKNITISDIDFKDAPKEYKGGLVVAGLVTIYGTKVSAEVTSVKLENGKEGISVSIGLPASWKLSDSIEGFTAFDSLSFAEPTLVLTNFDHIDFNYGVPVRVGANAVASVALNDVKSKAPGVFNSITSYLSTALKNVVFHAVFKKPVKESTFHIHLPPSSFAKPEFPISEFLPAQGVPQSVKDDLSNIKLKAPLASYDLGVDTNQLTIQGEVNIFGIKVASIATLGTAPEKKKEVVEKENEADQESEAVTKKAIADKTETEKKIKTGATLRMYMPSDWNAANTFPELRDKIEFKVSKTGLVLSSMEYEDEVLGIDIEPGLNIVANVEFADLPKNELIGTLVQVVSKLVPRLHLHSILKPKIAESIFELALPGGAPVPLGEFMDIDAMLVPDETKDAFKNIAVRRPGIGLSLAKDEKSFYIDGGATFYEKAVDVKLIVAKKGGSPVEASFYLFMPKEWKVSEMDDSLEKLDAVTDRPVVVLSTYQYDDKELKVTVNSGLNMISGVNLVGPLAAVQTFVDNFLRKFVVVEGLDDLILQGSLKRDVTDSSFKIDIPAQVGLDFLEMKKQGVISNVPLGLNRIMIGNLMVGFGVDLSTAFGAGIEIFLESQPKEPVEFRGEVESSPTKTSILAYMKGMLDPAFGLDWLALGELGIELNFDYPTMAATELPITGLGFRGKMNLGEGEDKAKIDVAGKIEMESKDVPDFAFFADAENLNLGHFVWLLAKMAKGNIPEETIPKLLFEKLKIVIIPKPTTIAGKDYNEGVAADVKVTIFDTKGGLEFEVTSLGIHGSGRLDNVETPIVILKGPGPDRVYDTPDDGPVLGLDIGLDKQEIFIDGLLEFPAIKTKLETKGSISLDGVMFKSTAKLFGEFEAEVEIQLKTDDISAGYMRGFLKQNALSDFEKMLKKAADDLIALAKKDIEKSRGDVRRDIGGTQEDIRIGAVSEKARVKKRIAELEKEIRSIRDECDDAPLYKQIYICPYVGGKLVKPGGELAGLKTYLATLEAAPVAEWVVGAGGTIAEAGLDIGIAGSEAVAGMAKGFATFAGQAINIKEITFDVAVKDLTSAKLPKVTIKGVFFGKELEFKDMQFDLANPIDSAKSIVKELIKLFD